MNRSPDRSTELRRNRYPQARITYDRESGDQIETREIPFLVGVLAGLSGELHPPTPHHRNRRFQAIGRDNFDEVLREIGPQVSISVGFSSRSPLLLRFAALSDFDPDNVRAQIEVQSEGLHKVSSTELDDVLNHPGFKRVEAAWKGLYFLVSRTPSSPMLRIQVMAVSKEELRRDLLEGDEVERTELFNKVYWQRRGLDEPFALLVGDYEFGRTEEDVEILERISEIAEFAQVPFLAGAAPGMFGLDDFSHLGELRNLPTMFQDPACARWNSFRERRSSKYVGLVLPRILLPRQYFPGRDSLWGNSAYALATRITNSMTMYVWPAFIRGVEGGGLVDPVSGTPGRRCTEARISDRMEWEVGSLGFIPIVAADDRDAAVFLSVSSCHKPVRHADPEATALSILDAHLTYRLAAARFIHYLRCIPGAWIGNDWPLPKLQSFQNKWLSQYVLCDDSADQQIKARFPLREADLTLTADPEGGTSVTATLQISPHFILEDLSLPMTVHFRLID